MNPLMPEMVRMQAPQDAGSHISVAGFLMPVEDGCVEVRKDMVQDMRAHGFEVAAEVAAVTKAPVTKK